MFRPIPALASLAMVLLCGMSQGFVLAGSDDQWKRVEFESAAQPLGSLQQRLARERGEVPKDIPGDQVVGYLTKPNGDGPFPAIVLLHGCSGLREGWSRSIAQQFVARGYVALFVDSFTTRGIDRACTPTEYNVQAANIGKRPLDAFGALLYLARLPIVDTHRIAVVGFSQGGGVALSVTEVRPFEFFKNPDGRSFRAAVAFYPPCKFAGGRPGIPRLILVGEADDWTPAIDCTRAIARWGQTGTPVEQVTFGGAFHDFNVESYNLGRRNFDHWLEYSANATAAANARMRAFLAQHLAK